MLKFRKDSRIEYTLLGPPFLPIYVSVTSLRVCGNFQKQQKSLEKLYQVFSWNKIIDSEELGKPV